MKKYLVWIGIAACLAVGGVYYRYHGLDLDERGATLLMRAYEENSDSKKTERLIKRAKDVNKRDKSGRTALFYAARHTQDAEAVRRLLEAGADPSAADKRGRTALMTAAELNPSAAVLEALASGGSPVDAADAAGETALTLAARHNRAAVIKILLRAGANPDVKTAGGMTAAELLAQNEKLTEQEKTDYRQAMLVVAILRPLGK